MRNFILVFFLMFTVTASAEAIKLPPVNVLTSTKINDIIVSIPVNTQITISEEAGKYNFRLHVEANLSDFQEKFNQIIHSYPLPSDKCGIRWFISNGQINLNGDNAIINISGEARWYWCHSSLRCTNVQDVIIFGQKIGSTCIAWTQDVAEEGPITQPFSGSFHLHPLVAGPTINIEPIVGDVTLGGQGGKVTQDVLQQLFNINLQAIAQQSLSNSANSISVSFPPDVTRYNANFESAKFVDLGGGKFGLIADASATLTTEQLSEKLREAIHKK